MKQQLNLRLGEAVQEEMAHHQIEGRFRKLRRLAGQRVGVSSTGRACYRRHLSSSLTSIAALASTARRLDRRRSPFELCEKPAIASP